MVGSVTGAPLQQTQLQANNAIQPGITQQKEAPQQDNKVVPASETKEAQPSAKNEKVQVAETSERNYDSGATASGSGDRGTSLDITV